MNFFRYVNGGVLFFIDFLITIIALFCLVAIIVYLSNRFNFSQRKSSILTFVFGAFILFGSFFGLPKIIDPFHHGVIRELFIYNSDNKPLLTVWLTRIYTKRYGGSNYDERLKTFDLETGKPLGLLEMKHRHYTSDYHLYWSKGDLKAWGYSKNTGAQFLSLKEPMLIKIAYKVPNIKASIKEGWPLRIGWFSEKGWSFINTKQNLGKKLLGPNGKISSKSITLLKPHYIEELNANTGNKDKIWVTHKSTILGDYNNLISYIDVNGQQINQINLNKFFKRKKNKEDSENMAINKNLVQAIATYTVDNEILLFLTCGKNFRSRDSGFTLTALKINKTSGKILGKIDYIK